MEDTKTPLADDEIETVFPGTVTVGQAVAEDPDTKDTDGTDSGETDGTDSGDTDGTDGTDSADTDGTDS